jgi:hypothetical protein
MGHLGREILTYGSVWLAALALVIGTVYFLRERHRDRHYLFVKGHVLHGHFDVIHAHANGDLDHVHDAAGAPVTIEH